MGIKNNLLKNRKSAISSTLTWIIATFIILLILFVYFIFLGLTVTGKSNDASVVFQPKLSQLLVADSLIDFLKTPLEGGTMQDLLEKSGADDGKDSERSKTFKEQAKVFLETNFPSWAYTSDLGVKLKGKDYVGGYYSSSFSLGNVIPETALYTKYSINIAIPISVDKEINLNVDVK